MAEPTAGRRLGLGARVGLTIGAAQLGALALAGAAAAQGPGTTTRPRTTTAPDFRVAARPDGSKLPGFAQLQDLTGGIYAFCLVAALVAFVLGCAAWGFGSLSANYGAASVGKRATGTALLAALLLGSAPFIVNFFINAGPG